MPLPTPNPGEKEDAFVERCMSDEVMVKEFPDEKQRLAVCRNQAKSQAMINLICEPGGVTIEAEAPADEGPKLPRFSMIAYTGRAMRLAGWRYPVVVDLAGLRIPAQSRPVRFGHDENAGVGHTDSIRVDNGQLIATGVVSRGTEIAREIVHSAKNGFPWQASIGASVDRTEFVPEGKVALVNGQEFSGPVNVVREATLGEISFVDLGADGATSVTLAAKRAEDQSMEPTEPTPVQSQEPIGFDDGTKALRETTEALKREQRRQATIRAKVEEMILLGLDPDRAGEIGERAITERWTPEQTELHLLRAMRPVPIRHPQEKEKVTPTILECALAIGAGVSDEWLAKRRDYGPAVVERAWKLRNAGLRGVIAEALMAAGHPVPHGSADLYRALLDIQAAGGFSTLSVSGIISGAANKILLAAFDAVNATYPLIAEQRDLTNFNQHTIYRLDHLGDFAKVAADGELKHGRLSETTYTNQVETYGQMLTLTRQAIVNDDLGAFNDLARIQARKARLALEKALYTLVCEASDSFYTTARGNRISSAALNVTNLGTAEAAMLNMADANGDPIYATPRFLVVPPALRATADTIYTSSTVVTGENATRPSDNPFKGRFEVVVSPYLSASSISGSSTTTWYLLADPNLLPAFQVAYLNGQRAPVIETSEAEFDVLGLRMRVYWDFGVARLDYRGAIKCTA
jgi:hypothetical protein